MSSWYFLSKFSSLDAAILQSSCQGCMTQNWELMLILDLGSETIQASTSRPAHIEIWQHWYCMVHLGFYRTKKEFWPDFANFKHDYNKRVLPVLLIFWSAKVRGLVSFTVSYWVLVGDAQTLLWSVGDSLVVASLRAFMFIQTTMPPTVISLVQNQIR